MDGGMEGWREGGMDGWMDGSIFPPALLGNNMQTSMHICA